MFHYLKYCYSSKRKQSLYHDKAKEKGLTVPMKNIIPNVQQHSYLRNKYSISMTTVIGVYWC